MLRFVTAAALAGVLAGCATGYNVDAVRTAEPTGNAFTRSLTSEYRELAVYEADQMHDWRDADHYAVKGLAAAGGEAVAPDAVASRDLPAGMVGTLESERARLVGLLDRTARRKAPQKAAYAQGRLDCWLEQQEENHQPSHIAACRAEFEEAIAALEAAMKPEPMMEEEPEPEPQAEAMEPENFIVYFGFDSARLTDAAKGVLDNAVKQAKKMQDKQVIVSAHTDTAGADAYNEKLSMRRAVAVKDYMTARGIDAGRIGIDSRGETRPAVKTGDNVREGANRRVEITLL